MDKLVNFRRAINIESRYIGKVAIRLNFLI